MWFPCMECWAIKVTLDFRLDAQIIQITEKDFNSIITSMGQRKKYESLLRVEPMTFCTQVRCSNHRDTVTVNWDWWWATMRQVSIETLVVLPSLNRKIFSHSPSLPNTMLCCMRKELLLFIAAHIVLSSIVWEEVGSPFRGIYDRLLHSHC